jgi:clostripain
MKKRIFILLAVLLALSVSCGDKEDAEEEKPRIVHTVIASAELNSWTIMVYIAADNNLERYAIHDFNQIEQGLYNLVQQGIDIHTHLNVVVLLDRSPNTGYFSGYSGQATEPNEPAWSDTRLYWVKHDYDSTYFNSERLDDGDERYSWHIEPLGDRNTGHPDTLSFFIDYTLEHFKSEHYALILWNHGSGIVSSSRSSVSVVPAPQQAIAYDDSSNGDAIQIGELKNILAGSFSNENKLALLGFDACLMAVTEVAYEVRNHASVMAASMALEPVDGWDYTRLFSSMTGNRHPGVLEPAELGRIIVESYEDFIESTTIWGLPAQTMSAVDLSKMDALKTAIDALATAIYTAYDEDTIILGGTDNPIEALRESSVRFWEGDRDSIDYPLIDLGHFCLLLEDNELIPGGIKTAAAAVRTALGTAVIQAYGQDKAPQSYYSGSGAETGRGLSLFFSRGNKKHNTLSHYYYQDWYTNDNLNGEEERVYGNLEFAAPGSTPGAVETWKDLMDLWYGQFLL